jgi:hypothetical protein
MRTRPPLFPGPHTLRLPNVPSGSPSPFAIPTPSPHPRPSLAPPPLRLASSCPFVGTSVEWNTLLAYADAALVLLVRFVEASDSATEMGDAAERWFQGTSAALVADMYNASQGLFFDRGRVQGAGALGSR